MNIFDLVLVQPIFNVLMFIYGIVPGHDFGIALILFTILIRLAMWPLVKKQLHQSKAMQKLQPQLKKLKERAKGNKQLESQLMMELYRENNVNPFSSIGLLIAQLPIFIALFAVVRLIAEKQADIPKYTYGVLEQLPAVKTLVEKPTEFDESLLGLIDLTAHAISDNSFYLPILALAVIAAALQYIQSKQLLPKVDTKRKLRDILKEQAGGKQVDQSEMGALMTQRMSYLFPFLTFFVSIYLAGALVLYLVVSSAVAILQQRAILNKDSDELLDISNKDTPKAASQQKAKVTQEAEVVVAAPAQKPSKKKRRKH